MKFPLFTLGLLLASLPSTSKAAITVLIQETVGNVVFTVTGNVGVPALQNGGTRLGPGYLYPEYGTITVDAMTSTAYSQWGLSGGPNSWGPGVDPEDGPTTSAFPHTGDLFFIFANDSAGLGLVQGHTSVDSIVTIPGTLQSLGINAGSTFSYTITGADGATDTLTITTVPEPSAALLGIPALLLAAGRRRR